MSDGNPKPITYDDIVNTTVAAMNAYAFWTPNTPWPWAKYPHDPELAKVPKETVLGYIEAWRWWVPKRVSRGFRPGSNNIAYTWKWRGENKASKRPTFDNSDGFYAYTLEGIEDHQNALFGRVALYGDVMHCKYGYRAEKARILDMWVDKDYICENPAAWELLQRIPQVKGVFDTYDPSLYNSRGEKEGYQCLILEHQKELSGTSLSDGRENSQLSPLSSQTTTMLVIDRRSHPSQWNNPTWIPSTLATEPELIIDKSKEWVVKPAGDICSLCDRLIMDGEPVAVSFDYPENYLERIADRTFRWTRRNNHMECAAAISKNEFSFGFTGWVSNAFGVAVDPAWDDTMYSTYGSIKRSRVPFIYELKGSGDE